MPSGFGATFFQAMNATYPHRLPVFCLAGWCLLSLLGAPEISFAAEKPAEATAKAAEPDLSTPAKAAEAFFKAVKAGDLAALKTIVSPRIQEVIAKGGRTMEDFAKLWAGQIEFKSAAEPAASEITAAGRVGVPVTGKSLKSGKEETHAVRFVKAGDKWLMDER